MDEQQKKNRNERQYKWQKDNTDRINVLLRKGLNQEVKAYAKSAGVSASEWINQAILEKMERQDADYTEEVTRERVEE